MKKKRTLKKIMQDRAKEQRAIKKMNMDPILEEVRKKRENRIQPEELPF